MSVYTGPRSFQRQLEPEKVGQVGCFFEMLNLERGKPKECVLFFLEEPRYAPNYGEQGQTDLIMKSVAVPTPYGIAFLLLWKIAPNTKNEIVVEHYLNGTDFPYSDFCTALISQERLFLIVIDNIDGISEGFFAFPNVYDFGDVADAFRSIASDHDIGDQTKSIAYVQENIHIKQLREMADF